MKRFMACLFALILAFVFLSSLSISEAASGYGQHGGGRGSPAGYYGGYHGHYRGYHGYHGGFRGGFYFGFGPGFWPGYYWGYYPYYWGAPVVGWPYASYAGSPYVGWPYYPPQATEAPPANSQPEQQQPYYWYYCQNPQGYYPYVKSCPGGWMRVIPNMAPPSQ